MKRKIDNILLEWKNISQRKVMLVRGARQVGKTYSIRQLGKTFKYYLEVNFEEERVVRQFFTDSLNPLVICQKLSTYFAVPIVEGETLLSFDEVQACPEALSALRFFYEKMPQLHVVAAGSLLEMILGEIPSQGVGRIQSLFMYPLSFDEFLEAIGEQRLMELKNNCDVNNPLDEVFHHRLVDYLKIYYIIGGMPEVVKDYVEKKDILSCQKKLSDLIETLRDDFAKYKKRSPLQRLRDVFDSIALQAGAKFKYTNIDSKGNYQALKGALDLIIQAGLAYKVYHTSAQGIPLGAQIDVSKFKIVLFDTGIHQKVLGLNIADIIVAQDFDLINKGHIAEIFTGLEIIKNSFPHERAQLYYWHKEKRASTAEVDYVLQKNEEVIPIEVKSGIRGKMQSIKIFFEEHKSQKGIRISLENFSHYNNIEVYPLYAIQKILR